ncbi:hypothetical protein L6452_05119 [Arctium lappa]|uniref:Uncharacterized protein n=1 Tax=Arctium lappa TaxID=4217 RepID=A0ACB9EG48_ARCLA|nr:hypothetical protein L6452_05119 [Arctium lappa]
MTFPVEHLISLRPCRLKTIPVEDLFGQLSIPVGGYTDTMAQNPNPAIDPIADAELIPEDQFLPLTPNNYHLDVTQPAIQYQVIIEILHGHPLSFALTETAEVPLLYLQHFWRSLTPVEADDGFQLEGQIDHTPVLLTRDLFRQFLHLPTATSFPGRDDYDPIVSDATLCADILSLGYDANLRLPSGFNKKHLITIWYTLFTYINRCLSAITKGIEQSSINILRVFHAVAFHRHADYADFLWYELVQKIPVGLLANARPTALSVIAYRHTHNLPALMVRPEPEGPPQGARPERHEGPRPRTRGGSVWIAGASGQGVMRENIVRGTGVGSAVGPSQAIDLHQPTSSQVATSATQSHVLRQGIEGAAVDLAAQLHTP